MVNRDVLRIKINHIQRYLSRLEEKKSTDFERFQQDLDIQDVVIHNLQLAIQGCIDTASHIVSDNNWGIIDSMAALFDVLIQRKVITQEMGRTMRAMTGFRNLLIHEYAQIDMEKVYDVLQNRVGDFRDFLRQVSDYARL